MYVFGTETLTKAERTVMYFSAARRNVELYDLSKQ